MDFSMNVERTFDPAFVFEIMFNSRIWDEVTEDGAMKSYAKVDLYNQEWVKISDGDKVVGMAQFKQMFNNVIDSHIFILPEMRQEYSLKAGQALLDYLQKDYSGFTIFTSVPECCKNVINFLEHFNFKNTGFIPNGWVKGGKKHSLIFMCKEV